MRIDGNSGQNTGAIKYYQIPPGADENTLKKEFSQTEIKNLKRTGKIDCSACKNRKYVDGSDDPGVSFKTPAKIDPSQSGIRVLSHEREHYSRENAKAARENKEVLQNSIRLFHDICEECGRVYVSGGETTTVTKTKPESDYFWGKDYNEKLAPHFPDKVEAFV